MMDSLDWSYIAGPSERSVATRRNSYVYPVTGTAVDLQSGMVDLDLGARV